MARLRREALLLVALLLGSAGGLGIPGPLTLQYVDASTGLPREKPGSADDAGWTGVRFADVNGDGWLDLGAIGRKGNGTQVYLGDGQGTWTRSNTGISTYFSGRSDLRFGDLDGDGALDVVDSNGRVWLGDGTGAWSAGPQNLPFTGEDVALGDVDNDGDLDVAVIGHLAGGLRVFLNDGTARWTSASQGLPTGNGGHKIELADVDLDGCLDVVASYWYDGGVWLGDCEGKWRDRSGPMKQFQGWGVAVGDLDGDGLPDVVFGTLHGQDGSEGLRVFLNQGDGNFTARPVLLGAEPWGGIALADMDGDGALDLVAGRNGFSGSAGRVALLIGDGAGNLVEVEAGLPGLGVDKLEGLAAADIDHSGLWDVGLAHYGDDGVRVWKESSSPASLRARLLEPAGGEVWIGGGLRTIRWATAIPPGQGPGTVDLAYSTTGPGGPWVPIATGIANSASSTWRVADAQSANAWVRVTVHAGGESASATGAAPFGLNTRPGAGPRIEVRASATPAQLAPLDTASLKTEVANLGFLRVDGALALALARAGVALLEDEAPVTGLPDGGTHALTATWTSTLADRPGSHAVKARFEGAGSTPEGPVGVARGGVATFTLVRPWIDIAHALPAEARTAEGFRATVSLTNTGNLPAQNLSFREEVPAAYLFEPNGNRLLRAAQRDPASVLRTLASDPAPAAMELDPARGVWVLTYDLGTLAVGATAQVRYDLLPMAPGEHRFAAHADYAYHYAHREKPTPFEAEGSRMQAVAPPGLPVP